MHSNRAIINKNVEICMELFFCTKVTTSSWLYTWELSSSNIKFELSLNMKGISFFLLTLYEQNGLKKNGFHIQISQIAAVN